MWEMRFARVFNATPMAIAMLDKRGRITRSNAAFARLMPEALKQPDGAARSIFAGILDRDHGAVDAAIAAAFQSTPDIPPVDAALAGEGERSARLFLAAADEHDGNGATIYALDTTEQRALQSNFAQSQKMQAIGQLAGGVAHDFNNVLTAIIGYCDLLLANHRPTDPSFRDINQIKQNANRAASLVRQLLAFSRRQTLRPQVLQLGDVLSDLQMLMRRLVGEKIDLELRHGRDLWQGRRGAGRRNDDRPRDGRYFVQHQPRFTQTKVVMLDILPPSGGNADAELAAARSSSSRFPPRIPSTQLAAELGVCRRTLTRWLHDAELGFPRPRIVHHRLYFARSEIDNWKTATAIKAAEAR